MGRLPNPPSLSEGVKIKQGLDRALEMCYHSNIMTKTTSLVEAIELDGAITVPEAAKILGKPKMTLYRWIKGRKLTAIRFGNIVFVPKSEVERLKNEIANLE